MCKKFSQFRNFIRLTIPKFYSTTAVLLVLEEKQINPTRTLHHTALVRKAGHFIFALFLAALYATAKTNSVWPETAATPTRMNSSNPQNCSEQRDKVCIVGSGNWGCAIATLVGRNCERLPFFEPFVNMWVYEEEVEVDGVTQKLSHVINTRHENVKYLPGIRLPENIVAVSDLEVACRDATLVIFVLPHQFLPKLMPVIRSSVHPACRGVSLIKGLGKHMFLTLYTFWSCSLAATQKVNTNEC